jgi:hypothetical protein
MTIRRDGYRNISANEKAELFIVWQVIRVDSDVIRLRIMKKTNRLDVAAIFQESLADAVHSIHNTPVAGKNDGKCEIALQHQPSMINDVAAGQ